MPKGGVEPPLPYGNYALNVARLPVPPLRQVALTLIRYRGRDVKNQPAKGPRKGRHLYAPPLKQNVRLRPLFDQSSEGTSKSASFAGLATTLTGVPL